MSDILLQYMNNQRGQATTGLRVWDDGRVQRPAASNPLPGATERLDRERALEWEDVSLLAGAQLEALKAAIRTAAFFDIPAKLLINYCKDDPGAALWKVNLDGHSAQVLAYDPRPKQNGGLDQLLSALKTLVN